MATLERAGEILGLDLSKIKLEEKQMKADGVIQKKKVDATQWGNRLSFMIGNRWYSCFDKSIGDTHVKDLLHGLAEGDEVELDVVEKPNKNKPGEVFYNIVGAVRVDRVDREGNKMAPPASKQVAARDYEAESDKKDRGVALRYSVDMFIAGKIDMGDIYSQADYFLAYIKGQKQEEF